MIGWLLFLWLIRLGVICCFFVWLCCWWLVIGCFVWYVWCCLFDVWVWVVLNGWMFCWFFMVVLFCVFLFVGCGVLCWGLLYSFICGWVCVWVECLNCFCWLLWWVWFYSDSFVFVMDMWDWVFCCMLLVWLNWWVCRRRMVVCDWDWSLFCVYGLCSCGWCNRCGEL